MGLRAQRTSHAKGPDCRSSSCLAHCLSVLNDQRISDHRGLACAAESASWERDLLKWSTASRCQAAVLW